MYTINVRIEIFFQKTSANNTVKKVIDRGVSCNVAIRREEFLRKGHHFTGPWKYHGVCSG